MLIASPLLPATSHTQAREPIDLAMLARIRDEGMQRSQAMEHVIWLSDIYGPRLTGSPTTQQAADWTMAQFRKWELANVHLEHFPFGKGWSLDHFSAVMTEPQVQPIIALPKSWTRGTGGPVTGEVVIAQIRTEEDMAQWRGKLRGRIVLTQPARVVRLLDGPIVLRMDEKMVAEAQAVPPPRGGGAGGRGRAGGGDSTAAARGGGGGGRAGGGGRGVSGGGQSLAARIARFYNDEGVVALFDRGSDSDMSAGGSDLSWQTQRTDGGTIFVGSGGSRDSTAGQGVPQVTLAVEHYNRMARVVERGVPVKVALDIRTRFHDEPAIGNGFNVIAEFPGTDLRDEIVLIGGHFDSHHGGTGATDNATGVAQMMEALRILKTVGARPRRTIRIALWGAEENGLIGSRAYVQQHLGTRDAPKPGHDKHSVYFNSDNGTGRFVGIWMQSNDAMRPIFGQWIEPLRDLGMTVLGPRSVASTDHSSFDNVGIPAFQFMVDRLEYNSRTHHSNMDVVDRVQPDAVRQAATVAATFAYLAAMRDERLPRKPAPEGARPPD
jgi:hypothetical protein